ncbi:16S rRNA (guanine(527)-N(7))-methyltransferase RsmG [Aquabacterium sp. J223]|uniref:16S rRNA (guanine(527)-N(7))-methyltransferase RsmG n=1 Tax=Aquabacterium sp. J223 TaxID=2898431 RepID=UPI0021AD57CA|nr:16S rRNA (guanine(527)-N(7))-methyltransferase RsmG [Aquabacterium sp. J223]UUX96218.1 16S rRNA (guanine(527)-N(7))-methyltransferase RsmG [Aquabacterium sp. J223]
MAKAPHGDRRPRAPGEPERTAIAEALRALSLPEDAATQDRLFAHLRLLCQWNGTYNLTAVRDPADMVRLHLADCLAAVPALVRWTGGRALRVLDVGSGGGLPGAVIASLRPELEVDCVDTVGKKAAFIRQLAMELRLPNLRAVHSRVEALPGPYDLVTCRAFASLSDLVRLSAGALAPDGVWAALKASSAEQEIEGLTSAAVFHVEPLVVPGLDAARCIVWMHRAADRR